jgi:hypothetical protein
MEWYQLMVLGVQDVHHQVKRIKMSHNLFMQMDTSLSET